jgi:hypothetical protein
MDPLTPNKVDDSFLLMGMLEELRTFRDDDDGDEALDIARTD